MTCDREWSMPDRPIRLGILLETSASAPAWIAELIGQIRASTFVDLAMIGQVVSTGRPMRPPMMWRLFAQLDRWVHARHDDAFAPVPADAVLSGIRRGGAPELAAASASKMLDVVLDLTGSPVAHDVPTPEHGSWWVDGGSADHPQAFWSLLRGEHSSAARVRRLGPRGVEVIGRAYVLTDQQSVFRTTSAIQWKCGTLVMRALRQLHLERQLSGEAERATAASARWPAWPVVAWVALRIVVAFVRREWLDFGRRTTWFLALRTKNWRRLAEREGRGFVPIVPPTGHAYADPFLFKDAEKTYVFFEDLVHAEGKAVISCAEVTASGLRSPRVVVRADHHLSYPFVFRSGDTVYMLPESTRVQRLDLYRAVEFPWRWELDRTLMSDTYLADATLLEHEGLLWLFGTTLSHGGKDWEDLHAWHARSLDGPWTPHPLNPVVSDVRSARPAGRIFLDDGALIRPGQDCSVSYGSAVTLNRIDLLTTTQYAESSVGRIGPEWYPGNTGTHTIDHTDQFEVIDARAPLTRS